MSQIDDRDILDQMEEIAVKVCDYISFGYEPGRGWQVNIGGEAGGTAPTFAGIVDVAREILEGEDQL